MRNSQLEQLVNSRNAHALVASLFNVPATGKTVTVPTETGRLTVRISTTSKTAKEPMKHRKDAQ